MSGENVELCQRRNIDAYLAVSRAKHGSARNEQTPPQEKRVWRAMREKLSSQQGRQIYSRLTRIIHQLSAAGGDAPHPAALSQLGVLDVLLSTPPRPSDRNHHCARHLATLATKPGE
jgi:hypothetical protein